MNALLMLGCGHMCMATSAGVPASLSHLSAPLPPLDIAGLKRRACCGLSGCRWSLGTGAWCSSCGACTAKTASATGRRVSGSAGFLSGWWPTSSLQIRAGCMAALQALCMRLAAVKHQSCHVRISLPSPPLFPQVVCKRDFFRIHLAAEGLLVAAVRDTSRGGAAPTAGASSCCSLHSMWRLVLKRWQGPSCPMCHPSNRCCAAPALFTCRRHRQLRHRCQVRRHTHLNRGCTDHSAAGGQAAGACKRAPTLKVAGIGRCCPG